MCHEGFCTGEEDPFPDAPGIWIASTVTGYECLEGGHTDAEADGLSDFCENNLAEAFAPELVLASESADPATREPRWAARPLSGYQVRILYMPLYHIDYGTVHGVCAFEPGWIHQCAGHLGDSEAIALTVEFNIVTQHWVLKSAHLSQHGSFPHYGSGLPGYPTMLEYPDRVGGYPRVHVATGKHANYSTNAECQAGGYWGLDSCSASRNERLATGAYRNIGSDVNRFVNCVGSSHPVYGPLGYQECYWTNDYSAGWTGGVTTALGYKIPLQTFGFID